MSLSSWLWGANQIDEAVDKATSELLPSGSEDIALNLEICDQIRSKSVPARDAMRALKRRLNHKNPNVQLLALGLTDICIKNGGDHFLVEVASREFMENLVSILKMPTLNHDVKSKILRLVQNWAIAFEGKFTLSYAVTTYETLRREGYSFPPRDPTVSSAAMVDTQTAPEWIDSDRCMKCRDEFTFTNRKHHCRNCGLVYDQKCSSKAMPLPHFGIVQEVRVCDTCYIKLHRSKDKAGAADPRHRRHASTSRTSRHRSAQDLYDAELQRAIQLSLEEVGAPTAHGRPGYVPSQPPASAWQTSEPPVVDPATRPRAEDDEDPDLKAAIAASLAEAQAPKASAPIATPRSEEPQFAYGVSQSYPPTVQPSIPALPNYDLEPMESDAIMTFSQTVNHVHNQGGRDIVRYPAVNELYRKATELRPKLAMSLDDTGKKEQLLTEMHEKMSQAVKLYDTLLTKQLTQPTWRSAPQHPAPSQYTTVDGSYMPHHQASLQPAQPQYTPYYATSPSTEQVAQIPYAQPVQHVPSPPWQQFQQYHTPTPAPVPTPQSPTGFQQYTPTPYQATPLPPVSTPLTPAAQAMVQPGWPPQASAIPSQHSTEHPSVPAPPPQQYFPSPVQVAQSTVLASPPPALSSQTMAHAPGGAQLPRHNTLSAQPSMYSPPANGLARHKTVPHQHQAAPVLPVFPTPPTSDPQNILMYGPSAPVGVGVEQERKEALLIDL